MEKLVKDILNLLAKKYLNLASKRNLLCVNKFCYWWIKKHIIIRTIPVDNDAKYSPGPCLVCEKYNKTCNITRESFAFHCVEYDKPKKSTTLPKRSVNKLGNYMECEYGHKRLCHGKDKAATCSTCQCKIK